MLSFVRYWSDCLLKELYHFAPPPAVNRSSCCTTSSPVFVVVSVWDFGPSHRCVVVSCFNLKFPSDVFTFYIGSVIHFEFMFVKGVRFVSRFLFFFWHMDVQLLVAPFFWKNSLCCIILLSLLCQRSLDFMWVCFWPPFLSSWSICLFFCQSPSVWITVAV